MQDGTVEVSFISSSEGSRQRGHAREPLLLFRFQQLHEGPPTGEDGHHRFATPRLQLRESQREDADRREQVLARLTMNCARTGRRDKTWRGIAPPKPSSIAREISQSKRRGRSSHT
eukprot:g10240.t1